MRYFGHFICWFLLATSSARGAEFEFERPPIDYHHAPVNDRLAQLDQSLATGAVKLDWDQHYGWLPSLLKQLEVSPDTQTLVFSKTSLQLRKISPATPRALYFGDDIYVGWVQHGEVVELSAVDSKLGAVFYTLPQKETPAPRIIRDQGECLSCHASPKTQNVPGYLVRSVYPGADGQPLLSLGTTTTDHRTPFSERFGGWYVTGTHGSLRHRGNVIAREAEDPPIDVEAGANCRDLSRRCDVTPYLSPNSDMVALMVLEHQTQMHNAITQAAYVTQQATHYDLAMNRALGREASYRSDSTRRRIRTASENVVEHLLFANQAEWSESLQGTSSFTARFAEAGLKDSQGRSLREFDLQSRLFKYPCSFLIYTESFRALPPPVLEHVRLRIGEILLGHETSSKYRHLTPSLRTAVWEILKETLPEMLPVASDAKVEPEPAAS